MIQGMLFRLYGMNNRRVRAMILWMVYRLEGGECHSSTLRRIFRLYHGVDVGAYSYGCFDPRRIPAGTVVGRYCSFAAGVVIFNANHPLERPSLHPFFYNPRLGIVGQETVSRGTLHIGHDVWMGHNALILPRVRNIGNGAVIGAGAVVTRDVPAYAIVGGNPAGVIRYRFHDAIRQRLEESRWWERSVEDLRREVDLFVQPVSETTFAHLVARAQQSCE